MSFIYVEQDQKSERLEAHLAESEPCYLTCPFLAVLDFHVYKINLLALSHWVQGPLFTVLLYLCSVHSHV